MTCYLNVLRQKEGRAADWIPPSGSIDAELTDQMRHFFSDYQHITRNFYKLNQDMNRLQAIDRDSHLQLYQLAIDEITDSEELISIGKLNMSAAQLAIENHNYEQATKYYANSEN